MNEPIDGLRTPWGPLIRASARLSDLGDRRRAELLAALLLVLVPLGAASAVIQLAVVPAFWATFVLMCGALTMLSVAYALSRTHRYRLGAMIASIAPVGACVGVGVSNSDDRVWYAFMLIGVLFATLFLRMRGAAIVAAATLAATALVVGFTPGYDRPATWVPPLALQAIFSPLMLLVAHYRNRIEEEKRSAQRALDEAHRLETVGRLAGGIAHDFGNLLAIIRGNATIIAGKGDGSQEIEDIQQAADRAISLVRRLLAYARRQVLEPQSVHLEDVVGGLEGLLRRIVGQNARMVIETPRDLPPVRADVAQLEQVIVNLVVNARDAMPGGGIVTIRMATDELRVRDPARPQVPIGRYVVLDITDTGVGMSEETRARVFEPFFSTKEATGGTGLGLSTVQGIVAQSGGHILVRSRPGAGTTFAVYLPALLDSSPSHAA